VPEGANKRSRMSAPGNIDEGSNGCAAVKNGRISGTRDDAGRCPRDQKVIRDLLVKKGPALVGRGQGDSHAARAAGWYPAPAHIPNSGRWNWFHDRSLACRRRSVKWLIHLFQFAPLKSGIATSIWRQEGYMAPKPKPARLVFAVGMVLAMALTILAVMTDRDWAAPSSSSPIYHPQLPLLY
jgi:hypothetical protein